VRTFSDPKNQEEGGCEGGGWWAHGGGCMEGGPGGQNDQLKKRVKMKPETKGKEKRGTGKRIITPRREGGYP